MFTGKATPISQAGIDTALDSLGVDAPSLWAVLAVETSGCGFLPDRRPKILFERHWFSRLTAGCFDARAPEVSCRRPGGYGASGAFQYERLEQAMALDREAALSSASWGLGQVMGFNAHLVGFADVDALVAASQESEDAQLGAMVEFIRQADIASCLRQGDWSEFARRYNGQDFQKYQYDRKLDLNHQRFLHGAVPDLNTRTAQLGLMLLGYGGPDFVDGWFGAKTQRALMKYQKARGLPVSGAPDAASMQRLRDDMGW